MDDRNTQDILREIDFQLQRIITGQEGDEIEINDDIEPTLKDFCITVNRLLSTINESRQFILSLAEGNLEVSPPTRNLLISPFKQLQANLLHLTWQTRQIAAGDYSQRVYFMGEFANAFNAMVEALEEKRRTEIMLREAQETVKRLEGIIPICMYCKKIRDDLECWQQLELYISEHSEAQFSHGICPDCFARMKSDYER